MYKRQGLEITSSLQKAEGEENGSGEELARIVEGQITGKVMNLLGAVYGPENVRVSVKCRINMEKLIRETLTYSTPDKIDETDKTGIVSKENVSEQTSDGVAGVGGVAGAETNADVTQYAGNTGTAGSNSYYSSEAVSYTHLDVYKRQVI